MSLLTSDAISDFVGLATIVTAVSLLAYFIKRLIVADNTVIEGRPKVE